MTALQAILLGLVQGVTEFLPVSSSGHLVLLQNQLNLTEPALVFDVLLHAATLLAVVAFFARELWVLTKKELVVIAVASVPAGLVGFGLSGGIEKLFATSKVAAAFLIVTGVFNLLSNWKLQQVGQKNLADSELELEAKTRVSLKQGLTIGLFQALAIMPGISRSGVTVFAGLFQGLERLTAFRFSFILSLPAIIGAASWQWWQLEAEQLAQIGTLPSLSGVSAAFVAGLLSLYVFKIVMKKANLSYFGYYCLFLGLVGLVWL